MSETFTAEQLNAMAERELEGCCAEPTCDCDDVVRALRYAATLAAREGQTCEWQPIETAPKDGSDMLLTNGSFVRTGYWARRINCWSIDVAGSASAPTHWSKLPVWQAKEPR